MRRVNDTKSEMIFAMKCKILNIGFLTLSRDSFRKKFSESVTMHLSKLQPPFALCIFLRAFNFDFLASFVDLR